MRPFLVVICLVFYSISFCVSAAMALEFGVENVPGATMSGSQTSALFDFIIESDKGMVVNRHDTNYVSGELSQERIHLFPTDASLNISAIVHPDQGEQDMVADSFVMAFVNNALMYRDPVGWWHFLSGSPDRLMPADEPAVLGSSKGISIINKLSGIPGHFNLYVGYRPLGSFDLTFNSSPLEFLVRDLYFPEVPVPETDQEKRQIFASHEVYVKGQPHQVGYHTILRSGDRLGNYTFGQLYDANGQPLVAEDGSPVISNSNDFASLHVIGNKLFMISHFESRPGAMYLTEIHQDPQTGQLTPISTRPIDFSQVRGGWVHCAGSVTPWNSHLGSEEYEPDASKRDANGHIDDYYDPMAAYYGGDLLKLNPYDYGWIIEVTILNEQGDTRVVKHYSMGRLAFELGYVLPDKRTVYMSDDGTNVGLFMFVADEEADLSSGTLYAVKWHQISSENGGRAELTWVNLGHATDDEIRPLLDSKITFNDIFERVEPNPDKSCPAGFTSINTTRGHECLKIKPGMEKAASRLETRRYAAMMGATTELRKEEGITYDPDRNRLYVAISAIEKGMEDRKKRGKDNDKYDVGGPNDIRVSYNACGGVYALDLGPYEGINSDYVAHNMYNIISGQMVTYPEDSPFAGNTCNLHGLANPDNITYLPGFDTLIIGEDTGTGHQNDFVWAMDVPSGDITRIQTTPYGSETTSVYWYPNINGFGYLISVVQHPYGESDQDKLENPHDKAAYTGYIGPFPALVK